MQNTDSYERISGIIGYCGDHKVFLGFAPACILHDVSFADILDEETGKGYQRPPNVRHSRDFSRYITTRGAATIPLTFNLRSKNKRWWNISQKKGNEAVLALRRDKKSMAQVDCQHRISELKDLDVPLAFMSFINLTLRSEMAVFHIINSKSRGLSSSLTDYHQSNLLDDLVEVAPHLFLAKKLNEDSRSPWYRLIKYGGQSTSGLKRRTSLRMMQKSIRRFMSSIADKQLGNVIDKYNIIVSYWHAVRVVFPDEWKNHRHSLITKGIGLYSLMGLLSDIIVNEGNGTRYDEEFFIEKLYPLKQHVDWNSKGMFANAGGHKGSKEVQCILREKIGL